MSEPIIQDRGRGPQISGRRITVYDVLDYYPKGWTVKQIAELFRLTEEQVEAAIQYIEEHKEEVMPKYERMVAFAARGNPPELEAKLAKSHDKLMCLREELDRKKAEGGANARAAG